ncbi:immunoglobulin superfamily member 1-like [Mauremys mutica]|uniref:immunoglobulin superfamily member 1-like n=1 Tax=Mauremys mutica TaxID=74926 RepID=UPI001D16C6DA|nr:immunoglobulin superfamily member 1-like [Mauremys mutica]
MASALMSLFLGCWLAGQCGVSGQLPAPGPSISVSPSEVIAPGQGVTIRCQCQCEGRRLFLYKGGIEIRALDATGDEGEFTIPSARREDSGSYSCQSRSRSESPDWSYPSNIVWITVAELSYQKPSISLHPSGGVALGGAVTVRCRGPYQNASFLLYKDGNPTALQDTEPAGDVAEFPIHNVSRRDAGSYSCYYCSKLNPFTWSHPSDPVELLVAEPSNPKPHISLHPSGWVTPGGAVTIRCECPCRGARVLLSKAGDPDARRSMDPVGDVAEFPIRNVSLGDAGNYSCQYSTKWDLPIWSHPSDPVELVVAGEGPGSVSLLPVHPQPDPQGVSEQDWAVGIRPPLPPRPRLADKLPCSSTDTGTFLLRNRNSRAQTCSAVTPGGSEPPGLTSPIITGTSAAAAGLLLLLLLVAFVCFRITRANASIDEGKELQTLPQEPNPGADGLTYAELDGRALQGKWGGLAPAPEPTQPSLYAVINYWWVLLLAGSLLASRLPTVEPRYPKPNISLRPRGQVALGGAVTIRCECRCRGARIFLSKAGDLVARRSMDPVWNVAEFPIHSVSWRDAGSYSCQYSTKSNPPVWSEPSDPVDLVISEAAATVYALMGEGKQLDVLPQEPDPGADALTYAELDAQVLQAKRGDPARQEPVLYATINPQEPDPGADRLTYAELDGRVPQATRGSLAPAPVQPSVYTVINVSGGRSESTAPPRRPDFTNANIAHLVLGAVVLLILGLTLAEAY